MVCTKQSMHVISLLHHIRMFLGPGTGSETSEWGVRVGQKRDTFWKISKNVLHMKVWLSLILWLLPNSDVVGKTSCLLR